MTRPKRPWLTFLLPSLLGAGLFMTPVPYRESADSEPGITIPVAILAKEFQALFGTRLDEIVAMLITLAALLSILARMPAMGWLFRATWMRKLFATGTLDLALRCVGAVFALLVVTGTGPAALRSDATGGLVLNDLLPLLFCLFLFAGMLLPLLLNYGLLEFVGTLLTKVMRPVFRLPGRSAIDCLTSWLGDGTVGVLLTEKQYEERHYTAREAVVIGTTFSAVSITFSLAVIEQVKLQHLFVPYYFAVCLAGLVAAIVVPRLWPLRRKPDEFIDGSVPPPDCEQRPAEKRLLAHGLDLGLERASTASGPGAFVRDGVEKVADLWFGVLPMVMAVGTTGLLVAEHTRVLAWIGYPFVPLLELLGIPEAVGASETMIVGFADMFTPSILAADRIASEHTRFVIAALSVTQLIYLSEVGAVLLKSKIPIGIVELFVVFLLRTVVTLPVIALVALLALA